MSTKIIKNAWDILKDTFQSFSDDKVVKLSGSLAYSTVFSMGPLLVVLISLCSIFLGREAVEGKIYKYLEAFLGHDSAIQLQDIVRKAAVSGHSYVAITVGVIFLLLGATSVFGEIQDSINGIWGIKPKPKKGWLKIIKNRILSFSVIVSLGFLLLVSLAITSLIDGFSDHLKRLFPDVAIVLFYIVNQVVTLIVVTLIFGVIFKVLPDARIKWKDIVIGAIVTALLFMAGKFGISFYISKSNVGSTYGAAGSLIVVLLWIYYSSMILYLGAELTKSIAVKYGSPIHPNNYAVTIKEVEVETGKKTIQEKEKATR
jgi:membrane protein